MTRKDFEAIALTIRTEYALAETSDAKVGIENLASALGSRFICDVPRFDIQRFMDACFGNEDTRNDVSDQLMGRVPIKKASKRVTDACLMGDNYSRTVNGITVTFESPN